MNNKDDLYIETEMLNDSSDLACNIISYDDATEFDDISDEEAPTWEEADEILKENCDSFSSITQCISDTPEIVTEPQTTSAFREEDWSIIDEIDTSYFTDISDEKDIGTEEAVTILGNYHAASEFEHILQVLDTVDPNEYSAQEVQKDMPELLCSDNDNNQFAEKVHKSKSKSVVPSVAYTEDLEDSFDANSAHDYALRVMSRHRFRYIYPPEESTIFSVFNDRFYEPVSEDWLFSMTYKEMGLDMRKRTNRIDSFCQNVFAFIRRECQDDYYAKKQSFSKEAFEAVKNRIVFQNGVYDITTGKLLNFSDSLPYDMGVDASYDMNYREKSKHALADLDNKTPGFNKLIRHGCENDKDSMMTSFYFLGYHAIPNRSAKAFGVEQGETNSGKNVFGEFQARLLCNNAAQIIDLSYLNGQFSFSRFPDARLLYCMELRSDRLSTAQVEVLKKLTGDEMIRYEVKRQNEGQAKNRVKLLLATNHGLRLPVGEHDEALVKRIRVIPFLKTVPESQMDFALTNKLWSERDVIMSRAARSLRELLTDDGGLIIPESSLEKAIKDSWRDELSITFEFLQQAVYGTNTMSDRISKKELFQVYQLYCSEARKTRTNVVIESEANFLTSLKDSFPSIEIKRGRVRRSFGEQESVNESCVFGLQWKDEFITYCANTFNGTL